MPPRPTSADLSGVATKAPKQGNESNQPVSTVDPSDQVLEEIIVTALRRESSVSELSLATFGADEKTDQRERVLEDQQIAAGEALPDAVGGVPEIGRVADTPSIGLDRAADRLDCIVRHRKGLENKPRCREGQTDGKRDQPQGPRLCEPAACPWSRK